MSSPINPSSGPIVVDASLSGPAGQADVRLILDTGATTSLIRSTILVAVGYDPDASPDRVQVAMGGGVQSLPRITLNRLSALAHHRLGFLVLSHSILPDVAIDGLLGLDFLRGTILTIDFPAGQITLV
jgi:aspartyl protease family protein